MKITENNRITIPQGWKELQLKEVLDYDQPNEYIVETSILDEETNIPVLTANKSFIKGYTKETKGIYENVPVIIFDDFTADNKFVNFPFKVKSSAMKILKLKDKRANLKFIFYQMQLIDVNTTTHKRYYISLYQNLPFIFPVDKHGEIDLEKQQQIVDEIEKQFTRLDASVLDLKKTKKNIAIYRNSILKYAYDGTLTKSNIEWKKVGDFTDLSSGKAFKKSEYSSSGTRLFQIANVTFGKTTWEETAYLPNEYVDEYPHLVLKSGDILMALNRPLLNHILKIAILNQNDVPAILYQRVGRFDFKNDINKKYFFYYMRSPFLIRDLEKSLQGVNIPFINKGNLLNFRFPYCSKKEQEIVVDKIESSFSVVDKIEEMIDSSLVKTEQLRKSILKNAFEGKLVKEVLV